MDNKQILLDALKFHGHKCWASVTGAKFMMQKAKTPAIKQIYAVVLFLIALKLMWEAADSFI